MEQEYTTTQVEKLPPSNTEEVINLDENGQVLLDKQMDEIKVLLSESIGLMSNDNDTSILSIRKDKFFSSENNHLPPYILTVKIDTTIIDKFVDSNRISLLISISYFDGIKVPTINTYANILLSREELTIPNDDIIKGTYNFLKSKIVEAYKVDSEYDTSYFPTEQDAKKQLNEIRESFDEEEQKIVRNLFELKNKVVNGLKRLAFKILGTGVCIVVGTIITFTAISVIKKRLK